KHNHGLPSAAPPHRRFNPREIREYTRIQESKESVLDFTKLWECDTSSCRLDRSFAGRKAVRGRPALQKHFMRNSAVFASISVTRGQGDPRPATPSRRAAAFRVGGSLGEGG